MSGSPEDLALVDGAVDDWKENPEIGPAVGNVVGMFLGTALVQHVDGAQWHVWPNGHPVVRTKSGHEYDVTVLAERRIRLGKPHLSSILAEVRLR